MFVYKMSINILTTQESDQDKIVAQIFIYLCAHFHKIGLSA